MVNMFSTAFSMLDDVVGVRAVKTLKRANPKHAQIRGEKI